MKDKAASLFYCVGLFGDLLWCHQNMLLLRPGWIIWWRKQLKCKSSCLGHHWVGWTLWVNLSFFFIVLLLFCCRVRGTEVGTHLWCISLSLHFRKSSVGTVQVSSWVPSLPPAAGPGSKKASMEKAEWRTALGPAGFAAQLSTWYICLWLLCSTVLKLLLSFHNTGRLQGAELHWRGLVTLERTGYTGKDRLYWWGLTRVLLLPAFFTLWLYHLLESTVSESTVLEPPPSLHR